MPDTDDKNHNDKDDPLDTPPKTFEPPSTPDTQIEEDEQSQNGNSEHHCQQNDDNQDANPYINEITVCDEDIIIIMKKAMMMKMMMMVRMMRMTKIMMIIMTIRINIGRTKLPLKY